MCWFHRLNALNQMSSDMQQLGGEAPAARPAHSRSRQAEPVSAEDREQQEEEAEGAGARKREARQLLQRFPVGASAAAAPPGDTTQSRRRARPLDHRKRPAEKNQPTPGR